MSMYHRFPLAVLLLAGFAAAVHAGENVRLTPLPRPGVTQTVSIDLEMGGDLRVESGTVDAQRLPVAAKAKLVFDEVRLPGDATVSARHYRSAGGRTLTAQRTQGPTLRESRRLVLARIDGGKLRLTAPAGPLERSEYDLLETAADSLVLDRLVPGREMELGDTWSHDPEVMQQFTGLDSVGICEVTSVLVEASERFARCQMAGVVHGVVHGASTELEIDAIYLYDRKADQITRLHLAIRETREIGPATPGLDAVVKLRLQIDPAAADSPLTPQRVAQAGKQATRALVRIETRSDPIGFATIHDANWYSMGTRGNETTLRRVTAEGLVAHANIARLAPKPLDPRTALADFRSDLARSLGKDVTGIAAEEQWTNQHGCRVMAVVAAGKVRGTDVEWHAYQVAPPAESEHTHRLALTFTVETSELERLGGSDRELVDQLELLPVAELQAQEPTTRK